MKKIFLLLLLLCLNAFAQTNNSRVYIDQIGNMSSIAVNQSGTKNNYAEYISSGSLNTIAITQTSNSLTVSNYAVVTVPSDNNTVNVIQQSIGGDKVIFATVNNGGNSLLIQQKDSGSHWADITLSGGSKNVDVTQQGSASHMARINLSGLAQDLSITQSGSTQQYYSITSNCATAGGCAKITVNQGQ
jgi:hypothetical protein